MQSYAMPVQDETLCFVTAALVLYCQQESVEHESTRPGHCVGAEQ